MDNLFQLQLVSCQDNASVLSESELTELMQLVPEWQIVEHEGVKRLERSFKFKSFAQAMNFMHRVGELAETEGFHPTLLMEWGRVTVTWWAHKVHGLQRSDFVMAAKTDGLYMN